MIELPVTCQLCGEQLPDKNAAWDHDCPEWDRIRRTNIPTLAAHKNIIRWYKDTRSPAWARWLVAWGLRQAFPGKVDIDLFDALLRMPPKRSFKLERKLVKRGLVSDERRTEADKIRRRYEIETEMEERGEEDDRQVRARVNRRPRRR